MSDSTAMTVEFLRARLLSERSVSRTSKQRADQLAKRVVELEEQLRIVTSQRRKAEKAAAEVLSILEAQGLGEFSEVIDSSTDQEDIPGEQKGREDTVKEDDSSTISRMDRSEVDDALSESERKGSPKHGRSLSWKGNSNNQNPFGKKGMDHSRQRQRRSFLYAIDSSPRHNLGKSCRKNRRKETGFLVQDRKDNSNFHHIQEKISPPIHCKDTLEKGFDDCLEISNEVSAKHDDASYDTVKYSLHDKNTNPTPNNFTKDEEMEEALEKQAQLILLYQAEENSQREWEEKFNENNCSTTDSSENGKMTEMSDDSDYLKMPSDSILCNEKISNSSHTPSYEYQLAVANDAKQISPVSETTTSANNHDVACTVDQNQPPNCELFLKAESSSQELKLSGQETLNRKSIDGNHVQRLLGDKSDVSSDGSSNLNLDVNGTPDRQYCDSRSCGQSGPVFSNDGGSNLNLDVNGTLDRQYCDSRSCDQSGSVFSTVKKMQDVPNQLSLQQFRPRKCDLGEVLESLQRAKLSLKQELTRSTTQTQNDSGSYIHSHYSDSTQIDTLGIPVSSAALFRLPTDGTPQFDLPRSTYYRTRSSSAFPHRDIQFGGSSGALSSGLYPDNGVRFNPTGVKNLDSHVTSDMVVMPSYYTSMYSHPSSAMSPVFARDPYINTGLNRSSPDVRRI